MALNLPFGIRPLNPLSNLDDRYGPYNSFAEANAAVIPEVRALGATVGIIDGGTIREYWWKTGVTDLDLVVKSDDENVIAYVDGSLAVRDASISRIDTSINNVINIVDVIGDLVDASLDGKLNNTTDTFTGVLTVEGAINLAGTLTVDGSVTYINSVDLNVSDNIITLNYGETGSGVSAGWAGIKIDRGTADDYMFVFRESDDTFRIGVANENSLPGDTQAVATRENAPTSTGVAFWNNTTNRFDTHTGFTYGTGSGLSIPGTLGIRASATASTPTQIPVFTADPTSTTRTIVTRTPAQFLSDLNLTDYALSGTANQVNVSGSPRVLGSATTLSLPQDINITAQVRFDTLGLGTLPSSGAVRLHCSAVAPGHVGTHPAIFESTGGNGNGVIIRNQSTLTDRYALRVEASTGVMLQVLTDGTVSLRAPSTSSAATHIPVYIANPGGFEGTSIFTRTPAQLRTDIGAGTGNGTVTSVAAGNGMSFTTITGSGTVTMGTPGTLTNATSNGVTAASHTHAITNYALSGTTDQVTVTGSGRVLGATTTLSLPQSINTTSNVEFNRTRVGDGTAAIPAFSFKSDTNTGFFRQGTDTIGVSVVGAEEFRFTSTGQFHATGDIIAFSATPSDRRLKKDVEPLHGSLDKVLALNGVSYKKIGGKTRETHIGFIAQDVEEIIPDVIKETNLLGHPDDELFKMIKYTEIIPYLTEAIKEQQKMILDLRKEIEELKRK
jgi:hypothetical protein